MVPATVSVKKERFAVLLNVFDGDTILKFKTVHGHKFNPQTQEWSFPLDYDTYEELKSIINPQLDASASAFLKYAKEDGYKPSDEFEVAYTPPKLVKPYKHQIITFNYFAHYPHAANFSTMGTGKTITQLMHLDYSFANKKIKKALIITPLPVIDTAWLADGKLFPRLRLVKVYGNLKQRIKILEKGKFDIFIINWEYLGILNKIEFDFDYVAMDESAKARNPSTQRFSVLKKYLPVDYTYLLSGLPAPNTPLEYWSQFYLLDRGLTLGQSFYTYRSRYFYSAGYGGYQWKITEPNRQNIENKIKAKSIRFMLDDCVDMPPNVESFRKIPLQPEHLAIYKKMETEFFVEAVEKRITASKIAAKAQKLRQITGGYVLDEDKKVHLVCENKDNAKYKELENIVFEEFPDKKIIVFSNYNAHTYHLYKHFTAKKVSCGLFYGGEDPNHESHASVVDAFQNDDMRLLIANPKSAGMGITLTKATVIVWFVPTWSYEDFDQARQRVHRIGLDHKTYEIFLVAEDTLELKMYQGLKAKKQMSDVMLEAVAERYRLAKTNI